MHELIGYSVPGMIWAQRISKDTSFDKSHLFAPTEAKADHLKESMMCHMVKWVKGEGSRVVDRMTRRWLFKCAFVCGRYSCVHTHMPWHRMWQSEDSFVDSVLSFHPYVGSGD